MKLDTPLHRGTQQILCFYIKCLFCPPGQPKTFLTGFESVIKMLLMVISIYVSGVPPHRQPQFCHTGPGKTLIIFLANNYFKVMRN